MVFQGVLLDSMDRILEAKRCCELSAAILNQNMSDWYLFCPNINNNDKVDYVGDYDDYDVEDSGGEAFGISNVNMAWLGLVVGMFMIW